MNATKAIDILNELVTINNDRIEGYKTASGETTDRELKDLFTQCIRTSEMCRRELADEIKKLGGIPEDGTKTTGKFFRAWMEVKTALSNNDRKAVLKSCETGEDVAVGTYEKIQRKDLSDLTSEQVALINKQHGQIKADHDKVKTMRDTELAAK